MRISICLVTLGLKRYVKDAGEQRGQFASFTSASGQPLSAESAAELLIADCSQQLAQLSAELGLDPESPMVGIADMWRTNLEFMKWWLQNRREKAGAQ